MAQETKLDVKEILIRLAKLQSDVEYIKSNMETDKNLEAEMTDWEEASAIDSSGFFEKHAL